MLKRGLTYCVLMLVVLQSGMAMSDAHQLHQSGTEHVVFDEAHQYLHEIELKQQHHQDSATDTASQQWDCHHCCHCHGHFCSAMLISAERISLPKNSSAVPDYSENTLPDTFETFLRPPKA